MKARPIRKDKPHRGDDKAKVAWMHETGHCLVMERGGVGPMGPGDPLPERCGYGLEVHHDRPGGSRATDKRTARLCDVHHRTGDTSVERLGRQGFQRYHSIDMNEETARTEREWQSYKSRGAF